MICSHILLPIDQAPQIVYSLLALGFRVLAGDGLLLSSMHVHLRVAVIGLCLKIILSDASIAEEPVCFVAVGVGGEVEGTRLPVCEVSTLRSVAVRG
jgi:hypothetical protein